MKQETGRLKEILHVLNQHNVTHGINPEKLCSILEDLGPTYVKLGQIMSMRSDILPEKYCHELARLRTDVKPMSFNEIWKILNKELHNDPGQLFQKINQIPVGCASIAQVHEAVLGDGSKVVLKIQRPQIKQIMAEDIALLKKASGFLNSCGFVILVKGKNVARPNLFCFKNCIISFAQVSSSVTIF